MKKNSLLSIVFIIISILLASCGTRLSVTQRHYRSGYYIAHNSGKQGGAKVNSTQTEAEKKVNEPSFVKMDPKAPEIIPITAQREIQKNVIIESAESRMQEQKKAVRSNESFALQPKNTGKIKSLAGDHSAFLPVAYSDSDGLSWFWTIIVLILVIWLVGYLIGGFGVLGGVFNLLLLVALILLILWLLRII